MKAPSRMATKTLVIVESPNKIKKISSYLGEDYILRASYGHIIDLAKSDKKNRLGIDIEDDYKPKYKIIPDKKDKIQSIIDAASSVDQIYLATDPDREGEAIAFHLKSCLESTGKPIFRISFNEITKRAILNSIKSPGQLDQALFDAQQARRVLDRIVGFMASDFLRDALGDNLSAGRVQSVAVRLIADRESEIKAFKPDEYWNIFSHLKTKSGEGFSSKYVNKVSDGTVAKSLKKTLDKDTYLVSKVDAISKKRTPLAPLITSTMQQAASTRFNFPVAKTMKCAQSLYESGLITYMRTDSVRSSPESLKEARDYLKNIYSIPATPNTYGTKGSAQDAHEAIRPTDVLKLPQNIFADDDQQKLYRLIWERFMASQLKPAVYDTVTAMIKSSSGEIFRAAGRTLKDEGWLAIATDHKKNDDVMLPKLAVKDVLDLSSIVIDQKFTHPPSRYGEAALVAELEKKGIGRPSTYAAIIETIKSRNYVELKSKTYQPTDKGNKVINSLVKYFKFMNYSYTADMESKLDSIAQNKLNYVTMLDEFFLPFRKECKKAQFDSTTDYGITCPQCNSRMLLKHGKFGFYMSCIERPDCKGTYSVDIVDEKPVVRAAFKKEAVPNVNCPECNGEMCKNDGAFGAYYSCLSYPKCVGKRKIPYGKKCPSCKDELYATVFYGDHTLACMAYPKCTYKEKMSENQVTNWLNPDKLKTKKKHKSVKKVLTARKKNN